MITHDVDEAIYLADRIVLMTNGPEAVLAEIVENPLPKERDAHRLPQASALLRACATTSSISWSRRSKTFTAEMSARLRPPPRAGRAAGRTGASVAAETSSAAGRHAIMA